MSPSIVRMSNVVVDTVLYIHVRDFAPARGINAEKCLHSKFQKNTFVTKKKNWSYNVKKIAFLYRIEKSRGSVHVFAVMQSKGSWFDSKFLCAFFLTRT